MSGYSVLTVILILGLAVGFGIILYFVPAHSLHHACMDIAHARSTCRVTKMAVVSLADIAQVAKEKLDRNAYSYFRSGADEEQTLRDNEAAFRR